MPVCNISFSDRVQASNRKAHRRVRVRQREKILESGQLVKHAIVTYAAD